MKPEAETKVVKPAKPEINEKETIEDETDEDTRLKEELSVLIERLTETNDELYLPSLETIRQLIRSATTSITSVPKPLKYLIPHYDQIKEVYKKLSEKSTRQKCADIISVLAMVVGTNNECIFYRLRGDPSIDVSDWGHEYVRYLSSEIISIWPAASRSFRDRIISLVQQIVSHTIAHNAEAEACDLLMEIDKLHLLEEYIDENSYPKVSLYLHSCVPYVGEPENMNILSAVLNLNMTFKDYIDAMRISLILNDQKIAKNIFSTCTDNIVKTQLAFIIARQRTNFDINELAGESEEITEIMMNSRLSADFMTLVRELDILEGKTPEDVYKTHLENLRVSMVADSARNNLAASFVNGMVNAGFGLDKMFMNLGNKWLYKNKDHGIISATASIGLLRLWDVDGGLATIDKYLYSSDDFMKAGALLACGILNCGVRNEVEPAHALLSDYLSSDNHLLKICAILGIGIAYAGSNSALALASLRPIFDTEYITDEVYGITSISIGLIAAGTCNAADTELLMQQVVMSSTKANHSIHSRFIFLALGLLYLGRQSESETLLESLQILQEPFQSYAKTIVEMCSYAGTGNVLKVQRLLHICSEHSDGKKKTPQVEEEKGTNQSRKIDFADTQSAAVIGVALISMGEDIGCEMAFRSFGHLMQYGEPGIRRAVPLAIAMTSISNPKPRIIDMLIKFSHDNDPEVAFSAILGLGLVGAGTNNARVALLLRQLAQYYSKDTSILFLVRLSQGLTHLGKGTMTMSPYHSDKQIMKPVAVAALMNVVFASLDVRNLILGSAHFLLYAMVPAIEPRCLMTFDESLNHLPVEVRIGIAVETVAQAGKPKTITAFQTHTTPVLLAAGERAELATDEYIPVSNIMEGFVILRKNANFVK